MARAPLLALLWALLLVSARVHARDLQVTPVFVDDSPAAKEKLERLDELLAAGNHAQAVRSMQELLDQEAWRVVERPGHAGLWVGVRQRVHEELLARPALLERYRQSEGPLAQRLLEEGKNEEVEERRFLTPAGFEATLRLAQQRLEAARFDAAWRTLSQLDAHPDLAAGRAGEAAALAELIGRYAPSATLAEAAKRWRALAGSTPAEAAPRIEPPAQAPVRSPLGRLDPLPEQGSVPPSLAVVEYTAAALRPGAPPEFDEARSPAAVLPWALPTLAGERLYVNDGVEIAAYDAATLMPLWRSRPGLERGQDALTDRDWPGLSMAQLTLRLEDVACVAVSPTGRLDGSEGVLVCVMGYGMNSGRIGRGSVTALGAADGAELWSVEPGAIDPQLQGAVVRGPALIEGDAVIVALRKSGAMRRVQSAYLACLELGSGRTRWVRLLGSVGVMPYQNSPRASELSAVSGAVVYRVDASGVMAAVESVTGRVVWVRRLAPAPAEVPYVRAAEMQRQPWAGAAPIIDGDGVVIIEPTTGDAVRVDARDGRELARRAASAIGLPRYLVATGFPPSAGAGTLIAAVEDRRVTLLDSTALEPAGVVELGEAETPAGRVAMAGDRLMIPLSDGMILANPRRPAEAKRVGLPVPGHVLPVAGGAVVAAGDGLHACVAWPELAARLSSRLDDPSTGPIAALWLSRLAISSGHAGEAVAAVDRLVGMIHASPLEPWARPARRAVFDLLYGVVRGAQKAPAGTGLHPDLLASFVQRLALAAEEPLQQAQAALARGWLGRVRGDHAAAVEAYQSVLTDPALAGTPGVEEDDVAASAGWVASLRLTELVALAGYGVYEPFSQLAQRELELAAGDKEAALAQMVSRYPLARAVPAACVTLWRSALRRGKPQEGLEALAAGVRAAGVLSRPGPAAATAPEGPSEGEMVGRLIEELAAHHRPGQARRLLASARSVQGLRGEAGALDIPALERALDAALSEAALPRLGGQAVAPGPGRSHVLEGTRILEPLLGRGEEGGVAIGGHVVLWSPRQRTVSGWASDPLRGRPAALWSRSYESIPPVLLGVDALSALLYWPGGEAPAIERVSAADGSTVWRTALTQTPAGAAEPAMASSPGEEPGARLLAMDERTIVILRRDGLAIALDRARGAVLWTTALPLRRLLDASLFGGVLTAAGVTIKPAEPSQAGQALLVIDPRLGRVERRVAAGPEPKGWNTRWLRGAREASGGTAVLMAAAEGIAFVRLGDGQVLWRLDAAWAHEAAEAWVLGDRAVVMSQEGRLWLLTLADGSAVPLPVHDKIDPQGPLRVAQVEGGFAIVSPPGVVVFDRAGRVIGADAVASRDDEHAAALCRDAAVLMGTRPVELAREASNAGAKPDEPRDIPELSVFEVSAVSGSGGASAGSLTAEGPPRGAGLWFVEMPGGRARARHVLELPDAPEQVKVVEGAVVVGMGRGTVLIELSAGPD